MIDLQFDSSGNITGMESVEGENVTFCKTVNPTVTSVEWWLLEAETVIKQTLHTVSGAALEAYPTKARSEWILDWPGQLVLNCSQVFWTKVCCTCQKQLSRMQDWMAVITL
jgi:dynein heavy chain, axonemal